MSNLAFITLCATVSGFVLCALLVWAYRKELLDLLLSQHDLRGPSYVSLPASKRSDLSRRGSNAQASGPGEDMLRSAETAVEIELRLAESLDGAGEAASDAKRIRRRAMELAVILRRLRAQLSHG